MDVKNAVAAAKTFLQEIYAGSEPISDLSLEEVEFDQAKDQWLITVEFSRPTTNTFRTRARELLELAGADTAPKRRVQKVVVVSDPDGTFLGMRNREAA